MYDVCVWIVLCGTILSNNHSHALIFYKTISISKRLSFKEIFNLCPSVRDSVKSKHDCLDVRNTLVELKKFSATKSKLSTRSKCILKSMPSPCHWINGFFYRWLGCIALALYEYPRQRKSHKRGKLICRCATFKIKFTEENEYEQKIRASTLSTHNLRPYTHHTQNTAKLDYYFIIITVFFLNKYIHINFMLPHIHLSSSSLSYSMSLFYLYLMRAYWRELARHSWTSNTDVCIPVRSTHKTYDTHSLTTTHMTILPFSFQHYRVYINDTLTVCARVWERMCVCVVL